MQKNTVRQNIFDILLQHKVFSVPLGIILLILLVRIPLGVFNEASPIDPIAHFVLPAATAALLFALLTRRHFIPALTKSGALFVILLVGVIVEVVWEIIEYIVDLTLHLGWQLGNADTMSDLILAVVGSAVGGFIFVKLYHPIDV